MPEIVSYCINTPFKAAATDQDIYDVAVIIAGLQQPVLEEVIKQQMNLIMEV